MTSKWQNSIENKKTQSKPELESLKNWKKKLKNLKQKAKG